MGTRLTEMLPIPLGQEALAVKATELAEAEIQLGTVREAKKAAMKQFNDQLETLQGVVDGLAKTVKEGQGLAEVEVELREDWEEHTLSTYRLDTTPPTQVDERPMTEDEIARGPGLPFLPDSAAPAKKGRRGRKVSTEEETADLQS